MNLDLLSLIIFYSLIALFFLWKREKFTIQNKVLALYKTKIGLNLMEAISKIRHKNLLRYIGYSGIIVGFGGMAFIFFFLIKETLKFLIVSGTPPPLAPVLPGVSIPGAPTLSFWHWIIAIFIVAVVHEFSHGVFAKFYNVNIKSSGFAFLGPILAAFVEPDEKELRKKSVWKQLTVFAAGPFSNILLALIIVVLLNFVIAPVESKFLFEPVEGVVVNSLLDDYPMQNTGITTPFVIEAVNQKEVLNLTGFIQIMETVKPGEKVLLRTDKGDYNITTAKNPSNNSKAFLGVTGFEEKRIKSNLKSISKIVTWFNLLVVWLFIINLGVGLFNLLPIGPVDGGRMFYAAMLKLVKNNEYAKRVFYFISTICLILIFINLIPWLVKLAKFILGIVNLFF